MQVVSKAKLVGAPDQHESVSNPVVAHVNGPGALLLAGVVGY